MRGWVSLVVLALIAGTIVAAQLQTSNYLTITAGRVTQDENQGTHGTFTISKVSAWQVAGSWLGGASMDPYKSFGTGGACLIVLATEYRQWHPLEGAIPASCNTNSQCPSAQGLPGGAYCAPEHQCWVRPGPGAPGPTSATLCNRSNDYVPMHAWNPGTHAATRAAYQPDKSYAARVVACLNRAEGDHDNSACKSPDSNERQEVFGPIGTITPIYHRPPDVPPRYVPTH